MEECIEDLNLTEEYIKITKYLYDEYLEKEKWR